MKMKKEIMEELCVIQYLCSFNCFILFVGLSVAALNSAIGESSLPRLFFGALHLLLLEVDAAWCVAD